MGAIVVIKTSHSGNADTNRQVGMRDFGQLIIAQTAAGSYVNGLYNAMTAIVADSANYQMWYSYTDDSANPKSHVVTAVASPSGNNIFCDLGSGASEGRLKLQVRKDSRSGLGGPATGKLFNMDVVFSQVEDTNGYAYFDEAVGDIHALTTPTEAKGYLAAFKFLTRCK